MITAEKIRVYQKYGGDIDGISRGGRNKEKELFQDKDWSLIDSVFQDSEIIKKGLCSLEYKNRFEKTLLDSFDSGAIELINKTV
ncbi:hypothetical protein ACT3CE_03375 [Marinifilum sp. RC60d5]|uniref:hypothetical protein n=1 Tax=Marinifilum sp. RC60d5 TaxID=3458414 RepID=UPI004036D423